MVNPAFPCCRCTSTTNSKRGIGKNLFPTVRTVMFQEQVDMAPHGGASQAMGIDPVALLTRAYLFRLVPHRCRDQVVYQANWVTYADLSSHRGPRLSSIFACMVPSKSLTIRLTSGVQIKGAIKKFGVTSFHVNARLVVRTSREDKYRRPSLRKRNWPYDHSN